METKKQTALEYFIWKMYDLGIVKLEDNDKINKLSDFYHECLAMEKDQIIEANEDCSTNELGELLSGEQYYNQTYGK